MFCSALGFFLWTALSTVALQYANCGERWERTKASSRLKLVTSLKKEFHGLKNKVDSPHEHVGDIEQSEDWESEEEDLKKCIDGWDHMSRFKHVGRLKLEVRKEVAVKVQEVVEQHLSECHLVVATTTQLSPTFTSILRRLAEGGARGSVVVAAEDLSSGEKLAQEHLLQGQWGGSTFTCQALIFYLEDANTDIIIRFLEESRLWHRPQTVVVLVGGEDRMEVLLHHSSLRNSIHTLYIAIDWSNRTRLPVNNWLKRGAVNKGETNGMRTYPAGETEEVRTYPAGETVGVRTYRRCLYCDQGEAGIQLLRTDELLPVSYQGTEEQILQLHCKTDPRLPRSLIRLQETLRNMMGHRFKVVTLFYCPVVSYRKVTQDPGAPVVPQDSVDVRILDIIAARFNFTYEMREPLDGHFGTLITGRNWSGIVGTLQHDKADMSLDLTVSASRSEVIDYSKIYFHDPFLIVSLQPKPLPRHLALIRPFTGEIWGLIIVFILVTGVSLWAVLKAWSWVSSKQSPDFFYALFYIWSLLLESNPFGFPANISAKMLVGWWVLSCLVLGTAYRSSLIAHLSVQGKTEPINSFEDILKQNDWSWGFRFMQGSTYQYFEQNTDPIYIKIFKGNKNSNITLEGIKRVLAGRFSYIAYTSEMQCTVAPLYIDKHGNSPLYFSTREYTSVGWNAWGFRKGIPIIGLVSRMKQRMIETGLIDHWLDDLYKAQAERIREVRGLKTTVFTKVENKEVVVLGMDHLQGAFYIWLLGIAVALVSFLGENFVHCHTRFLRTHKWKREISGASRCLETGLLKPDLTESDLNDPGSLEPRLLDPDFL